LGERALTTTLRDTDDPGFAGHWPDSTAQMLAEEP
jgi:hypothetical protein